MAKSTPTSPQSDLDKGHQQLKRSKKEMCSPDEGDSVVPTSCLLPDQKASPFASSDSLTTDLTRCICLDDHPACAFSCRYSCAWLIPLDVNCQFINAYILSPCCSNEDFFYPCRDHSDGIWNESQATVLQVDSGTENGTVLRYKNNILFF